MNKTSLLRISSLVGALLLTAGPLSVSHAMLDKTRFVAHLGVAYYAFHHWVLAPYKAGQFTKGNSGQVGRMAKAGLALVFASHEVNVAQKVAHNSHDPLLQKLDAQLVGLKSSFSNVGNKLQHGQLNPADIQALDQSTSSIGQTSAAGGQPIHDVATIVPGM